MNNWFKMIGFISDKWPLDSYVYKIMIKLASDNGYYNMLLNATLYLDKDDIASTKHHFIQSYFYKDYDPMMVQHAFSLVARKDAYDINLKHIEDHNYASSFDEYLKVCCEKCWFAIDYNSTFKYDANNSLFKPKEKCKSTYEELVIYKELMID